KAAHYRDRITALRQVQAQQIMEAGDGNQDVVACVQESGAACVHVLYVRQGRVMGSKSYFPKNVLESDEAAVLSAFISHMYLGGSSMDQPSQIIVSHALEDETALAEAIESLTGKPVKIISNVRTYRAKWLA